MRGSVLTLGVATLVCLAACLVGCAANRGSTTGQAISPQASLPGSVSPLSSIIHSIITEDGWEDRQVTVVGYFRGWDLLGEVGQGPPITRGDCVVTDRSGAIYYVGTTDTRLLGTPPEPYSQASINHVVRITGVVRATPQKQRYLEATEIEVLD